MIENFYIGFIFKEIFRGTFAVGAVCVYCGIIGKLIYAYKFATGSLVEVRNWVTITNYIYFT